MDNAGLFKYVQGFVIGRPAVHGQELMGMNQYDAVTGITDKYKVPVIMDADIGHIPPQMPVVCGAFGKIKTENGEIYMDYEFK
jgi:muramoyltetrapeptide carboxypeptidase LdcA involved in peptidoglycan recycling